MILLTAGCGGLLPKTVKVVRSPWSSFAEAKAAYDRIIPLKTDQAELKSLGFDAYTVPNVKILSYLDIMQRFMPNDSIKPEKLDDGVRNCIEARSACYGYEVLPEQIHGERTGNFWADFFNFKRVSVETGWSFNALIILKNDHVVFKLWSGTPVVDTQQERTNPLGPLQDSGDLVKDTIKLR